jgi:hypothetical protein
MGKHAAPRMSRHELSRNYTALLAAYENVLRDLRALEDPTAPSTEVELWGPPAPQLRPGARPMPPGDAHAWIRRSGLLAAPGFG